jgi:anaerobic magnesium-protoporphyrin IX monomethyl ester cyclase
MSSLESPSFTENPRSTLLNSKILFLTPPYERVAAGYDFLKHITNRSPSLGLLHLAAEVRLHGYEPSLIESDILGWSVEEVARHVIAEQPAFVGITLFTIGVWNATLIARFIKEALPETLILVGGPHISSLGKETMARFSDFDIAVVGEGELTLIELLETLRLKKPLENVEGIIYREAQEIRRTPARNIQKALDHLQMPAWDLLPDFPQAYFPAIYDFPAQPVATLAASRGCPFHCKFCDTSTFGETVRAYSPEKVFQIMKYLKETYGIRHILFVDDLFLASKKRTSDLCHLLLEHKLSMTWSCCARIDTVKPDILALMKKAGCWEISFGLETGSDELLQKMDKAAKIERSEQALQWAADAGIGIKGLFMLGYPGEDQKSIQATKDFIRRIPMTIMNLTKFTPYPGSPIYRELYQTNMREDHWQKMNGMNFLWAPEGMTIEQLDREYQQILISFYRRFRTNWYYLRFSIRYPHHLKRVLRFGLAFLFAKIRSFFQGNKGLLFDKKATLLDSTSRTL